MRHRFSINLLVFVLLLRLHVAALRSFGSLSPSTCSFQSIIPFTTVYRCTLAFRRRSQLTRMHGTEENSKDSAREEFEVVYIDTSEDDVPEDVQAELMDSQPSEWAIMKELLGINIFTYILGAMIAFFLSMNVLLGPGWLGSTIGIPGTGTFTEKSASIPDKIDLSKPEYLF